MGDERTVMVLWEQRDADGRWYGVTGNYIRVCTKSEEDLANRLVPVMLPRTEQAHGRVHE